MDMICRRIGRKFAKLIHGRKKVGNPFMKKYSFLLILAAGSLWGTMGVFVDLLTSLGFSTMNAALLRICSAAVMYVIFLLVKDKKLLVMHIRDLWMFLGLGLLSILSLTCFYFLAIQRTSYSIAAILLYTAPVMVSVMSAIFFKESFTLKKTIALILAFAGCVLVSGLDGGMSVDIAGFAFGILSGLAYALYSIFGKAALEKYHPYTVSAYAFIIAAVGSLIVCDAGSLASVVKKVERIDLVLLYTLLSGLITAFLPFVLYTLGLKYTSPGKAAILASVEPLVATVCGFIKGQALSFGAAAGIICILAAVFILTAFSAKSEKAAKNELPVQAKK